MDPVSRAQISDNSALSATERRIIGRPFVKGRSGNPHGRPKKPQITRMYEQLLANSQNRDEIKASLLETLKSRGMAKVLLLREMAERTEGKVAQEVQLDGTITLSLAETVARRRQLVDDSDDRES